MSYPTGRGPGRPRIDPGAKTTKMSVSVPMHIVDGLKFLGEGNLSLGLRRLWEQRDILNLLHPPYDMPLHQRNYFSPRKSRVLNLLRRNSGEYNMVDAGYCLDRRD